MLPGHLSLLRNSGLFVRGLQRFSTQCTGSAGQQREGFHAPQHYRSRTRRYSSSLRYYASSCCSETLKQR